MRIGKLRATAAALRRAFCHAALDAEDVIRSVAFGSDTSLALVIGVRGETVDTSSGKVTSYGSD